MNQRLKKSIERKKLAAQLRNKQKVGPQFAEWLQTHPGFDRGVRRKFPHLENVQEKQIHKPVIKPGRSIHQ